jgi:RND family efflux transporter MFP subunit
MRKVFIVAVLAAAVLAGGAYFGLFSRGQAEAPQDGRQGGGPGGGFGGGGAFRPPMAVELATVQEGDISASLVVVGNLIGEQTVDVVPQTGGRLVSISVRLGDPVRRGQMIAKIEDQEIVEQVKQAEASQEVARATIRQREADLKVAELNFERSKNLFERQLLAKQALDDAESRFLAGQAQLDLARAQSQQTGARLEELQINLANTRITSPVDGFVARRNVDPGAWVSQNAPIVSVVEISSLRFVASIVEKDLRLVTVGDPARVEVDAYPGESFTGRIARVSPVLDPATRTAPVEVEVPNPSSKLKPGMYARIHLTIEERKNATLAPKNAVVDFEGNRGVWVPTGDNKAQFVPVRIGLEDPEQVEITQGVKVGDRIITAGAASLRGGDTLVFPGGDGPTGGSPAARKGGQPGPEGKRPER